VYWNTVYPRSDISCNKICDISVENSIVDSCFYFTLKNIDDNAHRIRFYHTFYLLITEQADRSGDRNCLECVYIFIFSSSKE
jgi:hypothetical protein